MTNDDLITSTTMDEQATHLHIPTLTIGANNEQIEFDIEEYAMLTEAIKRAIQIKAGFVDITQDLRVHISQAIEMHRVLEKGFKSHVH